jgi:hypothetical protein
MSPDLRSACRSTNFTYDKQPFAQLAFTALTSVEQKTEGPWNQQKNQQCISKRLGLSEVCIDCMAQRFVKTNCQQFWIHTAGQLHTGIWYGSPSAERAAVPSKPKYRSASRPTSGAAHEAKAPAR